MTEGEKRRLAKETGPVTKEESVQDIMRQKIQEVDPAVRGCLKGFCRTTVIYFPTNFPMDRRQSGLWTMTLRRSQEKHHRIKALIGSAAQRWMN